MFSAIRYLSGLTSHIYRSGQALVALRQLQSGARQGAALVGSPGLARLAKALGLDPIQARDLWMGSLSADTAAKDLVGAHAILKSASKLSLVAPAVGQQAAALTGELGRTREKAFVATGDLAQSAMEAATESVERLSKLRAGGGSYVRVREAIAEKETSLQYVRDLHKDLRLLKTDA